MREHQLDNVDSQIIGRSVQVVSENTFGALQTARDSARRSGVGHPLLQLQRRYGNHYVQRMLALARQGEGEAEVTSEVESAIERKRGGGQGLDSGTRLQMESAFGADFSGVRVHTGAESHSLNRAVNAIAFTTGQDIFFRDGAYNPHDSSGRELLAHELTHVVQQGGAPQVSGQGQAVAVQRMCSACAEEKKRVQGKLVVGEANDQYEQEADRVARAVMGTLDGAASVQSLATFTSNPVQRQCACGGHHSSGGECPECKSKHEAVVEAAPQGQVLALKLQRQDDDDDSDSSSDGDGSSYSGSSDSGFDGGGSDAGAGSAIPQGGTDIPGTLGCALQSDNSCRDSGLCAQRGGTCTSTCLKQIGPVCLQPACKCVKP